MSVAGIEIVLPPTFSGATLNEPKTSILGGLTTLKIEGETPVSAFGAGLVLAENAAEAQGTLKLLPRAKSARIERNDGTDLSCSMVGRKTIITRASAQSIADNTDSNVIWDTVLYDDIASVFTVSSPSRFTVPTELDGAHITIKANVTFASSASGAKRLKITKNGAAWSRGGRDIVVGTSGGLETPLSIVTPVTRVSAGDYFEFVVYQNSGGALDVTHLFELWASFEIVRDPPSVRNRNFAIYQGDYAGLAASGTALANALKGFNTLILSHAFSVTDAIFPTPTTGSGIGCVDTAYSGWRELVREWRKVHPTGKVWGYVCAAADAPAGYTCGYTHPSGTPWTAAGVPNVTAWIGVWDALDSDIRPDGIFFDLVADKSNGGWISPAVRDDCYIAAKAKGFQIASNTTNASFINVAFAGVGLGQGDAIFIEGFDIAAGSSNSAATDAAMIEAQKLRARGISVQALASSAWGVNPSSTEKTNAKARFNMWAETGDTLAIQSSDVGLISTTIHAAAY